MSDDKSKSVESKPAEAAKAPAKEKTVAKPAEAVKAPVEFPRAFTAEDKIAALMRHLGLNFKADAGRLLVVK